MECEIKILLDKLIEFITDPAWLSVILSLISTIAVIAIARVQIRLQKRQAEIQEYDVYRKLYFILHNANNEIDNFFINLFNALWEPKYKVDEGWLQRKQIFIDELRKDLATNYIDFDLKFSKELFDKDAYLKMLTSMSFILQRIIIAIEQNEIRLSQGMQTIRYGKDNKDTAFAKAIQQQFTTKELQDWANLVFYGLIKKKKNSRCDDVIIATIRSKCRID